jgi:hypothetical protein
MGLDTGSFGSIFSSRYRITPDRITIHRTPLYYIPPVLIVAGIVMIVHAAITSQKYEPRPLDFYFGAASFVVGMLAFTRVPLFAPRLVTCARDGVQWGAIFIPVADIADVTEGRDRFRRQVSRTMSATTTVWELHVILKDHRVRLVRVNAGDAPVDAEADDATHELVAAMRALLGVGPPPPPPPPPLGERDLAALRVDPRIYRLQRGETPATAVLAASDGETPAWTSPIACGANTVERATLVQRGDELVVALHLAHAGGPSRRREWRFAADGTCTHAPLAEALA